ncbi:MAG: PilT protein domain protein [Candidatus Sulfotelmatobacter sp.]|nr:PilT protein domain protein [Candidatus Sulfotelmatobacter sp.]
MQILLDTHVLVWWMEDASRLSRHAVAILENPDNGILVSAVVGWEISIKVGIGKMKPRSLIQRLDRVLEQQSFSELPITLDTAVRSGLLPLHHRDPFDRLLVAQAQSLSVSILSADAVFDRYGVKRLW